MLASFSSCMSTLHWYTKNAYVSGRNKRYAALQLQSYTCCSRCHVEQHRQSAQLNLRIALSASVKASHPCVMISVRCLAQSKRKPDKGRPRSAQCAPPSVNLALLRWKASKKTSAVYAARLKVGSKKHLLWPLGTAVLSILQFVVIAEFVLQGMVYTYCCAMVSVCADHTAKCMLSLSAVFACGSIGLWQL